MSSHHGTFPPEDQTANKPKWPTCGGTGRVYVVGVHIAGYQPCPGCPDCESKPRCRTCGGEIKPNGDCDNGHTDVDG